MILKDMIEKAIREGLDVYIHFKMNKPDWAELVTTPEEIAASLLADSQNHLVLDPVFYIMRKLDENMARKLFEEAALTLIEDKRPWFPRLTRDTFVKENEKDNNKDQMSKKEDK